MPLPFWILCDDEYTQPIFLASRRMSPNEDDPNRCRSIKSVSTGVNLLSSGWSRSISQKMAASIVKDRCTKHRSQLFVVYRAPSPTITRIAIFQFMHRADHIAWRDEGGLTFSDPRPEWAPLFDIRALVPRVKKVPPVVSVWDRLSRDDL